MCDVTIVGLCRNSMPQIRWNADRIERLGQWFKSWRAFVYENDSDDGTAEFLQQWSAANPVVFTHTERHDRPQLSHEKSTRRTDALAEYRNACRDWAAKHRPDDKNHCVIVVDLDTWAGWSDDGVMSGLWWLNELPDAAGLASVSTIEIHMPQHPAGKLRIHYDAWAFRLNHWSEHDMNWFPHWFPPVGSNPVPCHSAFGGLAIYRPDAYYAGMYAGGDCEHVAFHRSIKHATGLGMYLNPGQRMVMNWLLDEKADGGQHGDD